MSTITYCTDEPMFFIARVRPILVITTIFNECDYSELKEDSHVLLNAALKSKTSKYEMNITRGQLRIFYDWMLLLSKAAYTLYSEKDLGVGSPNNPLFELKQAIVNYYGPADISVRGIQDTTLIIRYLCNIYPQQYVRSELWSMFEAGVPVTFIYNDSLKIHHAFQLYHFWSGLVEACYQLNNPSR